MLKFTRWKQITILGICLLGCPDRAAQLRLAARRSSKWPRWVPKKQLSLGPRPARRRAPALAHGGQRRPQGLARRRCATTRASACATPRSRVSAVGIAGNAVQVRLAKAEDTEAALKALRQIVQPIGNPILGTTGPDVECRRARAAASPSRPPRPGCSSASIDAIVAAIETVRRRVDAMGTTEPNIVREGTSRILVQVPGPAGYRAAEGADRQDGAALFPRGASHR